MVFYNDFVSIFCSTKFIVMACASTFGLRMSGFEIPIVRISLNTQSERGPFSINANGIPSLDMPFGRDY